MGTEHLSCRGGGAGVGRLFANRRGCDQSGIARIGVGETLLCDLVWIGAVLGFRSFKLLGRYSNFSAVSIPLCSSCIAPTFADDRVCRAAHDATNDRTGNTLLGGTGKVEFFTFAILMDKGFTRALNSLLAGLPGNRADSPARSGYDPLDPSIAEQEPFNPFLGASLQGTTFDCGRDQVTRRQAGDNAKTQGHCSGTAVLGFVVGGARHLEAFHPTTQSGSGGQALESAGLDGTFDKLDFRCCTRTAGSHGHHSRKRLDTHLDCEGWVACDVSSDIADTVVVIGDQAGKLGLLGANFF